MLLIRVNITIGYLVFKLYHTRAPYVVRCGHLNAPYIRVEA